MRKKIILITLLFKSFFCTAQNYSNAIPPSADYLVNNVLYNPAFAGELAVPNIVVGGSVFNELDRKPKNVHFFIHNDAPKFKSGVGLTAIYHKYDDDVYYNNQVYKDNKELLRIGAAHNYNFNINEDLYIRFGFNAGLLHFKTLQPAISNPNNPQPSQATQEKYFKFDLDVGAMVKYNNLFASLAVQHINMPTFRFYIPYGSEYKFYTTTFFSVGYEWSINDNVYLLPSIFLTTMASQYVSNYNKSKVTLQAKINYKDMFYGGLSYLFEDEKYVLNVIGGIEISKTVYLSTAYYIKNSKNKYSRWDTTLGFYL